MPEIPWGRSLHEYERMFSLTPSDLDLKILDCAGGTASFNAEMTRQGKNVTSCDPDYQLTAEQINAGLQYDFIANFQRTVDLYVWQYFKSPDHLGSVRREANQKFLADFPLGLKERRYVNASLPDLSPFDDGQFDLALCSHFLFTARHPKEFHLEAIEQMCRVAKEVRVFPLRSFNGEESHHSNPIVTELRKRNFRADPQPVDYEFEPGVNHMLRISKNSSAEK
jgi:ubiquinone/menaquinone biosynthesis C-methylase UbiE